MNARTVAFLFITFVSLSTLVAGQTPSFLSRKDYSTSTFRTSIAIADLNADGLPDMVAAGSSSVAVLLGNGDSTFQPAREFPTGLDAVFVIVADFNGDSIPDLAVAGGDSVSILLGNGDGTFQAPTQFFTGTHANFISVGDFNGDSIPDLAVTNQGDFGSGQGSSVSILLGNGDGSFSAATNYDVGQGPRSVAAGDFNGDGVLDLVVANWGTKSDPNDPRSIYTPDTRISILFGNGDGSFNAAQNVDVGSGSRYVLVGDFNHDGNADVAVALEESAEPNRGSVQILFGDGAGGFSDGGVYVVGFSPRVVASGDVDSDGVADLLVGNGSGDSSVLLGNADGSFRPAPDISAVFNALSLALADLNGDGKLDIVIATGGQEVSVILGNGDGSFQTARLFLTGPVVRNSIVTADFNRDGNADLVVPGSGNTISVLLGNGDGTFQTQTVDVGHSASPLAAADLNGDGIPDLVLSLGGLSVMLGNGDGTFQSPINLGVVGLQVAIGDVNGDGIPDLVVSGSSFANRPALVLLGNGDGTFQNAKSLGITGDFVAVGDFNRDGNLDVALVSANANPVFILLGNGDGTFQSPIERSTPSSTLFTLAVADLNQDGIPDLALTLNSDTSSDNVLVMLGNGDGTFDAPVGYTVGHGVGFLLAIRDINGDGIPDLVVDAGNSIGILTGNGDGGFQPAVLFGPGGPTMVVADFNNDGKPDVAISDTFLTTRGVAILINNHL